MPSAPAPRHPALRPPLLALVACFGIMWLLAVIGISRDMRLPVDERWAGSGMLALEGVIGVFWVAFATGWLTALRFTVGTVLLAYGIELFGVRTGILFGDYSYSGLLVPQLPGGVPLPITCAWLLSALGAVAIARRLAAHAPRWLVVVASALLSALLDGCIEPTAANIKGYWVWHDRGWYYGVPVRNFLGWFLAGLLINAVVCAVVWQRKSPPALDVIPIGLFAATVAMFAIIALFRGYPGATLIGAALCVAVIWPITRATGYAGPGRARSAAPSTRRTLADASAPSSRAERQRPAR